MKLICILFSITLLCSCFPGREKNGAVPVIGFLDFVEDATLAQARQGFYDALKEQGYSEEQNSLRVVYINAQGDIPTLGQAADRLINLPVDLIAANTTLSTITAVQRTRTIPVCMMVAPRPDLAGLADKNGAWPSYLFGVYETLDYIDTAVALIQTLKPETKRIGTIYNQSEPQSRQAFAKLEAQCRNTTWELISLPVNNSSESQLVTAAVLAKKPEVFFALPDNVIFASFETIVRLCNEAKVPVFTSEAGLVERGAVASFGADFYQWGYQAGRQAAAYLKDGNLKNLKPEIVSVRNRLANRKALQQFGMLADSTFAIR